MRRRDEDDDSKREESEAANEKTDLVSKTENNLLLPNRDCGTISTLATYQE